MRLIINRSESATNTAVVPSTTNTSHYSASGASFHHSSRPPQRNSRWSCRHQALHELISRSFRLQRAVPKENQTRTRLHTALNSPDNRLQTAFPRLVKRATALSYQTAVCSRQIYGTWAIGLFGSLVAISIFAKELGGCRRREKERERERGRGRREGNGPAVNLSQRAAESSVTPRPLFPETELGPTKSKTGLTDGIHEAKHNAEQPLAHVCTYVGGICVSAPM